MVLIPGCVIPMLAKSTAIQRGSTSTILEPWRWRGSRGGPNRMLNRGYGLRSHKPVTQRLIPTDPNYQTDQNHIC